MRPAALHRFTLVDNSGENLVINGDASITINFPAIKQKVKGISAYLRADKF
jgi:hypothetical protein